MGRVLRQKEGFKMVQKATFQTEQIVPLEYISMAEHKLLKLSGVRNAALDGATNELIVVYDSPDVSSDAIRGILEEYEYTLVGSTEDFHERIRNGTRKAIGEDTRTW
jgi:hypothetical protein